LIDPPKEKYMQILNIREIENNVNEAVQKYIRFLNEDNKENLNKVKLFAFLLKVRLYIKYISRNLLSHMLFDEYEQFIKDKTLAFAIAKYLSNKEDLSEENKSIIKNTNIFNKLYSLVEDITFGMPKSYIINVYNRFSDTLKANNIDIQNL
jgi:flagellin-specific chaperone FliS